MIPVLRSRPGDVAWMRVYNINDPPPAFYSSNGSSSTRERSRVFIAGRLSGARPFQMITNKSTARWPATPNRIAVLSEVLFFRQFLDGLDIPIFDATPLYCDNDAAHELTEDQRWAVGTRKLNISASAITRVGTSCHQATQVKSKVQYILPRTTYTVCRNSTQITQPCEIISSSSRSSSRHDGRPKT